MSNSSNQMPKSSPDKHLRHHTYQIIGRNDDSHRQNPTMPLNLTATPITILPKPPIIAAQPHAKVLQPSPYPPINYSTYPYQNEKTENRKPENQRSRTIRACDICRRKKIKCNTLGPGSACNYCKSIKLKCAFTENGKKRIPTRMYTEELEGRLKRMEKMLNIVYQSLPEDNIMAKKRKTPHEDTDMSLSGKVHRNTDDIFIYQTPEDKLANSIEISSISTELRTRFIGDRSPLQFLGSKMKFDNNFQAHLNGFRVKKVGSTLVFKDDDDRNGNQRFLEEMGMLKPGEVIKGMNDWIFKVSGLDRATSDSLMKIYFAFIHPKLPVLNKHLFLRQYRGEFSEYPSGPLLNAIYGAAARYIEICKRFGDRLDNDINIKDDQSEYFFNRLIVYIQRKHNPCISVVQAILIGQTHILGLDEKVGSRWLLSSLVIRMAQDLGLNRSSESWDIPVSEKETRKRVWWSVYILDRWTAAATGRPQTIFDDDCDVEYPNASADWEEVMDVPNTTEDEDRVSFPSVSGKETPTRGSIPIYQPFVELIKLSEILGYILNGLYTPLAKQHSEKHGSNALVSYVDDSLSKWRDSLPEELRFDQMNEKNSESLSKSGLLYASYCSLLILLHRPFIEKEGGPNTHLSLSSLSICTSAATRCVDVALKLNYQDCLLISWNFLIYPIFTASLIHINNAASPDKRLAGVAKTNLIKSSTFTKRIAEMSPGAARLHYILDQLTKLRDITVGTDQVLRKLTLTHGLTKNHSMPEPVPKMKVPHKRATDDVQSGIVSRETPPISTINLDRAPAPTMSNDYRMSSTALTQDSHIHLHNADQETISQMLPLEAESYSLRQFGLSMDVSNYNINHVPNMNYNFAIPVMNNFDNFGIDFINDSHAPQPFSDTYPLMDQTIFRNRPDNAFWSVPSGMVLDDWLAYFFPQQFNMESNDSWNPNWT